MHKINSLQKKYLREKNHRDHSPELKNGLRKEDNIEAYFKQKEEDEKIEKAIEKMELLDKKLKDAITEEKLVKEKSLNQSRQNFAELIKLNLPSTDFKTNVERYLALMPPIIVEDEQNSRDNSRQSQRSNLSDKGSTIKLSNIKKNAATRKNSHYDQKVDPNIFNKIFQTELEGLDSRSNTTLSHRSQTEDEDENSTIKEEQEKEEANEDQSSENDSDSEANNTKTSTINSKSDDKFIKRNIDIAKNNANNNYGVFMTEQEQRDLEKLLESDDSDAESVTSTPSRPTSATSISKNNKKILPPIGPVGSTIFGLPTLQSNNLAIKEFLDKSEQNRLNEIDSKLEFYQIHRDTYSESHSQSNLGSVRTFRSTSIFSDLSKVSQLKTDQSKMNFINSKLREINKTSSSENDDEKSIPKIMDSASIKNLANSYLELEREIQSDQNLGSIKEGEESENQLVVVAPKLCEETLQHLLDQARIELKLDQDEDDDDDEEELSEINDTQNT